MFCLPTKTAFNCSNWFILILTSSSIYISIDFYFSSISSPLVLKVGMGSNNSLYALEDGYVKFTKEVYIPRPRSAEATRIISKLPRGAVLYKTFINVLPVKQEGRFRLVELV